MATQRKFLLDYNLKELWVELGSKQEKLAIEIINGNLAGQAKQSKLIVESLGAWVLAVQKVVTNKSFRSPRFSREIPKSFEQQTALIEKLWKIVKDPKRYKATPLDRLYFEKPDKSLWPISIPSYIDRCMQALYSFVLDVYNECQSCENSYGFRPNRNQIAAIRRIQFALNTPNAKLNFALEVDIKKCFDTISHNWLLENIPMNKHILKEWLKCGYIERGSDRLHPTEEGTRIHTINGLDPSEMHLINQMHFSPQGSLISPILCNMTLNGLERHIRKSLEEIHKKGIKLDGNLEIKDPKSYAYSTLIRFADDMVFLCRDENIIKIVWILISDFLSVRNLKIKNEKTRHTSFNDPNYNKDPMIFLGVAFKKKENSIWISEPRKKNWEKVKEKIRNKINESKNPTKMIFELNPIVGGWCNYFRYTNYHNFQQKLTRQLYRRVFRKLMKIFYNKYWKKKERYKFILRNYYYNPKSKHNLGKYGPSVYWPKVPRRSKRAEEGKYELLQYPLKFTHRKISLCQGKNSYDKEDFKFLRKWSTQFIGETFKEKLLKKTNGNCHVCGIDLLSENISCEVHHRKPFSWGGKTTISNCIPVCTTCHRTISVVDKNRNNNNYIEKFNEFVEQEILYP